MGITRLTTIQCDYYLLAARCNDGRYSSRRSSRRDTIHGSGCDANLVLDAFAPWGRHAFLTARWVPYRSTSPTFRILK